MGVATWALLVVVAVMAGNQLVMRVGALRAQWWAFWSLQLVNLSVASWLLVWGLPGWELTPVVSWILGLLFLFRIVQNNMLRARFLRERQGADRESKLRRAEALRDAMARAEASEPSDS